MCVRDVRVSVHSLIRFVARADAIPRTRRACHAME